MDNKFNNSRFIPIIMIIGMIILAISVTVSMKGSNRNSVKQPSNTINLPDNESESDIPSTNHEFLGVVKEINSDLKIITFFNVNSRSEEKLFYKGSSDILDKYGQVIAISQIQKGEMVDVNYEASDITKLQISGTAWEYKGVGNLVVDKSNKHMSIGSTKYKYTDNLIILDGEEEVTLLDLNNRDELTVKGLQDEICSIIITKGHGYVRLRNYSDFIGGMVEVGYNVIMPVSEDMLIVAREGSYRLTMEKGRLQGAKYINVTRNEETVVDMSEFLIPAEKTGHIEFIINPEGADLTIDKKAVDYSEPVELKFGEHIVEVSLGGYNTYKGILSVNASSMRIDIELTEPGSGDDDTDSGIDSEGYPSDTDDEVIEPTEPEKDQTGTVKIDMEHDIKVKAPVGAEMYLNGILKGTVPVTILKEIGTHTISFRKSGAVTKSYTIEVIDDNEDVTFSFPELVTK